MLPFFFEMNRTHLAASNPPHFRGPIDDPERPQRSMVGTGCDDRAVSLGLMPAKPSTIIWGSPRGRLGA